MGTPETCEESGPCERRERSGGYSGAGVGGHVLGVSTRQAEPAVALEGSGQEIPVSAEYLGDD
jgi:hypothetical protein